MSVTGRVVNGVVVLPPGTMLPEGAEVKVETLKLVAANDPFTAVVEHILQRCSDGKENAMGNLPDDLAVNLDYYIHGHAHKQQPRAARWIAANGNVELTEQETVDEANQLMSMAAETTELPADLSTNHDHYLHGLPKQ
jgi:calcineurin-like phosphoesterase family protein